MRKNDDLISRQAVIDAIYHHKPSMSQEEVRQMLHEVPSAQPEIIRCEECQCFELADNGVNGFCMKHSIWPDRYDFCSMAEREEK